MAWGVGGTYVVTGQRGAWYQTGISGDQEKKAKRMAAMVAGTARQKKKGINGVMMASYSRARGLVLAMAACVVWYCSC